MLEEQNIADTEMFYYFSKSIKIIGCGGAGNNILSYLASIGVFGAETIALDTDEKHLSIIRADKKILLGKSITEGTGTGGSVDAGKKAAEASAYSLHSTLQNASLVLITAGMGGGTGTGAATVIARLAREYGSTVVSIVSLPFGDEKDKRAKAEKGVGDLIAASDTVIPIDFDRLKGYDPATPRENAFFTMDEVIADKLKVLTEAITQRPLVHMSLVDVKKFLRDGGLGNMMVAEADYNRGDPGSITNRLEPLLDIGYHGPSKILVHITCGRDVVVGEALRIAESVHKKFDTKMPMLWGARAQGFYEGRLKLMVILLGLNGDVFLSKGSL